MGNTIFQPENMQFQERFVIDWLTPVKTEPLILRAIQELVSAQLVTQQIVNQLAGNKLAGGRAFIGQDLRASEGAAFDESAESVRMLTQRVQDLEKRLEEVKAKKSAAGA